MRHILRSPNLREGDRTIKVRVYQPSGFAHGGIVMAEHVRSQGRGGDDVLLHINPMEFAYLKKQWGEPSTNPKTGLPEYGLFSKLKKALGFEVFNTKGIVKDVLSHPQRLLTGAVDPIGTKISNKMFGTNYDPMVNQLGGATEKRFRDAESAGMDTGLARDLHKVAGTIAGFYGGNAAAQAGSWGLGNAAGDLEALGASRAPGALTSVINTGAQAANAASGALGALTPSNELDYAKNPKNWGTIAKGVGAIGLLAGQPGGDKTVPPGGGDGTFGGSGGALPQSNLAWNRQAGPSDYYHYGETGPEHKFFSADPAMSSPLTAPPTLPPGSMTHLPYEPPPPMRIARGGALGDMIGAQKGGTSSYVEGPGSGRSDDIPARLSDGEYVMDAETVALLGDGSSKAGAEKLDQLRTQLRKHKGRKLSQGKFSDNAKPAASYLKG